MSEIDKATTQPRNKGAIKGGNGEFIFKLAELASADSWQGYNSPVIEGERIQVSLVTKTKGSREQRPHSHPNEQWTYIMQGTLRVKIGDQPERLCGPGTLLYIPADMVHCTAATPEQDVVFLAAKDLSHNMFADPAVHGTTRQLGPESLG